MNHHERVASIERDHPIISIARQAELLKVSRASLYVVSRKNPEDKRVMDCIDQIYTKHPFLGSRKIQIALHDFDIHICRDHVRRLMRFMGIEAIYPKARTNTSIPDNTHRKYPYLLRGVAARYPNHVWGTDITYVRLEHGWAYLVALLDWFSRYVVAWQLAPTLEIGFCIENLKRALITATPDIHNSDQGSHFTSPSYTDLLTQKNVQISMDGTGRCMDNIFTERLWRTVKYEDIFLKSYRNLAEARSGLTDYFRFYNTERMHQALGYRTPAQIYFKTS